MGAHLRIGINQIQPMDFEDLLVMVTVQIKYWFYFECTVKKCTYLCRTHTHTILTATQQSTDSVLAFHMSALWHKIKIRQL